MIWLGYSSRLSKLMDCVEFKDNDARSKSQYQLGFTVKPDVHFPRDAVVANNNDQRKSTRWCNPAFNTFAPFLLLAIFCRCIHVKNAKLTLLSVLMRLMFSNRDHIKDIACLVEDAIHFLQRAVRRFRDGKVNERCDGSIAKFVSRRWSFTGITWHLHYRVGYVDLVSDVRESNRGGHYDQEVEIQLTDVERSAPGARICNGTTSAG